MKSYFIHYVFIFLLVSISVNSEDLNVFVHYKGTCISHQTSDPDAIEKMSKYLEKAQNGIKLFDEASVEDVQKYYNDVQNFREYEVEVSAAQKESKFRIANYSPKGGYMFYSHMVEWVSHHNDLFYIHHPIKQIMLQDNLKRNQDFLRKELNPLLLLFKHHFYKDIDSKENITTVNETFTVKESEAEIFEADVRFISYHEDSNGNPKKSMIRIQYDFPLEYIWYAEFDEYQEYGKVNIPRSMKIVKMVKALRPISEFTKHGELWDLDSEFTIQDMNINEIENFRLKWNLELVDADVNTLENDYFWPEVPETYIYRDARSRMQYIRDIPHHQRTELQQNLLQGHGPYTFPK